MYVYADSVRNSVRTYDSFRTYVRARVRTSVACEHARIPCMLDDGGVAWCGRAMRDSRGPGGGDTPVRTRGARGREQNFRAFVLIKLPPLSPLSLPPSLQCCRGWRIT